MRHRDEDAPRQELLHQRARLQRALEGKEDDTHFGMPAKAYTPSSPHSLKSEDEAVALLAATADELDVALDSPVVRDRLLKKAQGVYVASSMDRAARNPLLLPLTEWLHRLHPSHPQILLLLACTYYMLNDFSASLWYNSLLLRIDPTYIEAMNNLGLTLRSLGRWHEAETWWWRTLQQRAYWDGYDHLLESLCGPHQWVEPVVRQVPVDVREALPPLDLVPVQPLLAPHGPRLDEALRLCRQMEKRVITSSVVCPERLAPAHLHRLQHLYYAMGNIKYVLPQEGVAQAVMDYEHSIQVALSYGEDIFTLRDLVVATCLVCILTLGVQFPTAKVHKLAKAFDIDLADPIQEVFVRNGDYASLGPSCVLELVHRAGDSGLQALLEMGDGKLPILYLAPTKAIRLPEILFQSTRGVLPALFHISAGAVAPVYQDKAGGMFSNVLLTVIKVCQTPSPTRFTLGGIETSVGLLLPCFYLAFAMHPSAPTCNNLGILLASLPLGMSVTLSHSPSPVEMSGQQLALWYYRAGLVLDPHHPHLYTSLGSLLKELDQLSDSISMYMRAVECAPNYDVALANLANAVKDQGRTQDSIVYYRRAVAENPEFAAALCGLVNALMAICSWDDVYEGPRLMDRVKAICAQEVHEGSTYGRGVLAATGTLEDWMGRISGSLGLKNDDKPQWREMLGSFFSSTSVSGEGSFLLRLVQRCARDAMRRWYLARLRGEAEVTQGSDAYPRLLIPEHLDPPPVPTILPFHTFTYPLTSRQIRIICHRNALRVTWATLTQPWVPRGVYPPPKPPGRIKVAYVSSDFTNHPMAHLMQSVFGMHDAREFEVYCFATSPNDGSPYRARIEAGAEHFEDVAGWDSERLVTRLVDAGIHVLINLHGYTKGARNEIFAARPCPVQVEYMGFAGPMNSSWTDWVIADPVVCPPQTTGPTVARTLGHAHALDPEGDGDWVYSDRFIYLPHSYFVNDHKQGFRDASPDGEAEADSNAETDADGSEAAWEHEEELCYRARRDLFPNLPDDYLIFVNANQLWKMDPDLFSVWLRILQRVPKSILWLLHFPLAGSLHLRAAARRLAGDDVAARIVFTPVAPKDVHIQRGRIADLFLDMAEVRIPRFVREMHDARKEETADTGPVCAVQRAHDSGRYPVVWHADAHVAAARVQDVFARGRKLRVRDGARRRDGGVVCAGIRGPRGAAGGRLGVRLPGCGGQRAARIRRDGCRCGCAGADGARPAGGQGVAVCGGAASRDGGDGGAAAGDGPGGRESAGRELGAGRVIRGARSGAAEGRGATARARRAGGAAATPVYDARRVGAVRHAGVGARARGRAARGVAPLGRRHRRRRLARVPRACPRRAREGQPTHLGRHGAARCLVPCPACGAEPLAECMGDRSLLGCRQGGPMAHACHGVGCAGHGTRSTQAGASGRRVEHARGWRIGGRWGPVGHPLTSSGARRAELRRGGGVERLCLRCGTLHRAARPDAIRPTAAPRHPTCAPSSAPHTHPVPAPPVHCPRGGACAVRQRAALRPATTGRTRSTCPSRPSAFPLKVPPAASASATAATLLLVSALRPYSPLPLVASLFATHDPPVTMRFLFPSPRLLLRALMLVLALVTASSATDRAARPFGRAPSASAPPPAGISTNGLLFREHTFDYIIIGGGTAGLVLANRLSADPHVTVAVIEAGESGIGDTSLTTPDAMVGICLAPIPA